ncbi:hypothetical protein BDZ97DRAFT_120349 [Flammula alnicola]|nr:hypothetical protein BDZ97DRAFT_120349 [Flammula alnicola]
MTSGKGPGLPKEQRDWAVERLPQYMAKTGIHKAVRGQPIPKDDADLRTFLLELRGQFMAKFSESNKVEIVSGMTEEKIERRFDDFFRNNKAQAIKKWNMSVAQDAASGSVSSTPASSPSVASTSPVSNEIAQLWSSVFQKAPITGRTLFENENRDMINAEVNAARRSQSISHHQHVAMLKSKMKERWDSLGEDQDEWNERAIALCESNITEKEQRARNQAIFDLSIGAVLRHLIGPIKDDKHKIGHARFHVLYGYRDEDDKLCTGFIDVPDDVMRAPFDAFVDDYKTNFIGPWHECCEVTVLENEPKLPPPQSPFPTTFACDDRGCPILPAVCEDTTTPEALRSLLTDFVKRQWEWSITRNNPHIHMIPPIPWNDPSLTANLADPTCKLLDPASAKAPALYALLSDFKSRQPMSHGFQLFNFPKPTSSALLKVSTARSAPPLSASNSTITTAGTPKATIPSLSAVSTTTPQAANPTCSSVSSPSTDEHSTATPLPSTASPSPQAASTLALTPPSAAAATPSSATSKQTFSKAASPPAPIPQSNAAPTLAAVGHVVVGITSAQPLDTLEGTDVGTTSASSKKNKKRKSNKAVPVPHIPVANPTTASKAIPKKGNKRKSDVTEEAQENVKRAKRVNEIAPIRRSARQLQAEAEASSSHTKFVAFFVQFMFLSDDVPQVSDHSRPCS